MVTALGPQSKATACPQACPSTGEGANVASWLRGPDSQCFRLCRQLLNSVRNRKLHEGRQWSGTEPGDTRRQLVTVLGGQWQVLKPLRFTGRSCHTAVKKFKVALLYCHETMTMQ